MKKRLFVCVSLAVLLVTAISFADDKDKAKENPPAGDGKAHSIWMKRKLEHAQGILAGLANEDFEEIGKHAKLMNTYGALEQWFRADSDAYRSQLKIFRFANSELIRLSEEKNLEGATLAYTQLTLSCVNCHSHVRRQAR